MNLKEQIYILVYTIDLYKVGRHSSTSSHNPEKKQKYPRYEHCHLGHLWGAIEDGVTTARSRQYTRSTNRV